VRDIWNCEGGGWEITPNSESFVARRKTPKQNVLQHFIIFYLLQCDQCLTPAVQAVHIVM